MLIKMLLFRRKDLTDTTNITCMISVWAQYNINTMSCVEEETGMGQTQLKDPTRDMYATQNSNDMELFHCFIIY